MVPQRDEALDPPRREDENGGGISQRSGEELRQRLLGRRQDVQSGMA